MSHLYRLRGWIADVAKVPWLDALMTLAERFREDRLGLTASSLTFTTTIALVPFITVALAVFTAFPMFAKFQGGLQQWLIESLVPDNIARQVLGYLNQFAGKASKLGALGLAFLMGTALALIFTIDRTLNSIWRVRTHRPLGQRVLIYWTVMTLGPLLLGISVSLTSYVLSSSQGVVRGLGGVGLLLELLQFAMVAAGMAALFRYVPNTHVRWGHAWMGGLFVAAGIEIAKRCLTLYLSKVPTYSAVYGAFATVPILLVWIYVAWVIVLLGATLTAYAPSLIAGVPRRRTGQGWQFQLALEVLRELAVFREQPSKGLTIPQLCIGLQTDPLRLEPVLEALVALDWVGELKEFGGAAGEGRMCLLVDVQTTSLAPLLGVLLLPNTPVTEKLWRTGHWPNINVRDAL